MKILMIIDTARFGICFSITYLVAILVAAGIMIHEGFRKKYPMSTWLLIILSGVIFFIIGTKVATYSPQQWVRVLTSFGLPNANGKTILGGIAGLFAGIFLAKSFLRFKGPVLDTLAVALPVGMAISRTGCLMAGCCFGTPTRLPWGIQYDVTSFAYQCHISEGLVHLHDKSSIAVHPAQLYQVIGCLIIAFVVWRLRKQWKSNGNLFLFSVLCYLVLRFFVEFVRAPETNFFAGQAFLGLKIIQWLIMVATLFCLLILLLRESKPFQALSNNKNHRKGAKTLKNTIFIFNFLADWQETLRLCAFAVKGKDYSKRQPLYSDKRKVFLLILISLIAFSGRKWFDLMEFSTIIFFLLPAVTAIFLNLYMKYSAAGFRWIVPVLLIFSFSFMAQKSIPDRKKGDKITFTEVGFAGQVGKYYEELKLVRMSCGGPSYEPLYEQSTTFYQTGMNVSYNIWRGRYTKYTIGGRLFIGNEVPEQTTISSGTGPVYGFTPYVTLDWQWFGLGAGLSVGHMNIPVGRLDNSVHDGDIVSKGHSWTTLSPSLGMRLGPTDVFYFEASFPGLFPYMTPYPSFFAGFGTGLGKTNGTKVAFGYCYNNSIYGQMIYPIKNQFLLEASYADNLQAGDQSSRLFTIGFRYRFIDEVKDKMKSTVIPYRDLVTSTGPVSKPTKEVKDADGNVYSAFTAGGQVWMDENLKVTHYRDGSEISGITGNVKGSGQLYNWYAVSNQSELCPDGWHIPSINEWRSLINSLGGFDLAAGQLEESYKTEGSVSRWWSASENDTLNAQCIYLNNQTTGLLITTSKKSNGLSVRCIRDQE